MRCLSRAGVFKTVIYMISMGWPCRSCEFDLGLMRLDAVLSSEFSRPDCSQTTRLSMSEPMENEQRGREARRAGTLPDFPIDRGGRGSVCHRRAWDQPRDSISK